jgi:hypothetical protein
MSTEENVLKDPCTPHYYESIIGVLTCSALLNNCSVHNFMIPLKEK